MKRILLGIISFILIISMLTAPALAYSIDPTYEPEIRRGGDALYVENAPVIDGYFSTKEWGEGITFSYNANETEDDNVLVEGIKIYKPEKLSEWKTDIYFRWDENYLYAAVITNDPDVHTQGFFSNNIVRNDSVEMWIDTTGYKNNRTYNSHKIAAAYGVNARKSVLWDLNQNADIIALTKEYDFPAKVCVAPAGSSYTDDTQNGFTTYEMALPWEAILTDKRGNPVKSITYSTYSLRKNPDGAIGREFGFISKTYNTCKAGYTDRNSMTFGTVSKDLNIYLENGIFVSEEKAVQSESFETYNPADIVFEEKYYNTIDPIGYYYDYLSGDYDETTPVPYGFLKTLTYESNEDFSTWGTEYMPVESIKKYEDEIHGNVLCANEENDFSLNLVTTGLGTSEYPMSYTVEFDVKYEGNNAYFGNTFGGAFGLDFICGYYPEYEQFRLVKKGIDSDPVYAFYEKELSEGEWYHWKFQYDNITKTVRLYVTDGETEELVFDISGNNEFVTAENYSSISFMTNGLKMCFDNVKIYNFAEYDGVKPVAKSLEPGDVNADKKINAVDALIERFMLIGIKSDKLVSMQAADVNFDNSINAIDVNIMRRMLAGKY